MLFNAQLGGDSKDAATPSDHSASSPVIPGLSSVTPATEPGPGSTYKPSASSLTAPPTIERLDLQTIIRNEVNAANREWFTRLTRGMTQLLEDPASASNEARNEGENSDSNSSCHSGQESGTQSSRHVPAMDPGSKAGMTGKRTHRYLEAQDSSSVVPASSCHPGQESGIQSSRYTPAMDPGSKAGMTGKRTHRYLEAQNSSSVVPAPSLSSSDLIRGSMYTPSASHPNRYLEAQNSFPVIPGQDPGSRANPNRYIEAQTKDAKFAHFAFGDADHAYVAGEGGLWNAKLAAKGGASDGAGDDDKKAATPPAPGTQVTFTRLGAEKITLNGTANVDSPVTKDITSLTLYGDKAFPVVTVADEKGAKEPSNSHKLFAARDAEGSTFASNKLAGDAIDDAGAFYDASQQINAGSTVPDEKKINQSIVAMTASRERDRFFVAVADGAKTSRKLYKRPDGWQDTVRQAIIDGMKSIDNDGAGGGAAAHPTIFVDLTPEAHAPGAPDEKEKFTQAVMKSVENALFMSPLAPGNYQAHTDLLFRDAINLRKGGLLEHAEVAARANLGGATTVNILSEIIEPRNANPKEPWNIQVQANPANAGKAVVPLFKEHAADKKADAAAAIQVALGRGLRELAAATKDVHLDLKTPKPFASLDTQRAGDKDAVTDLNIYCADQDGLARGVCVADLSTKPNALITMDAGKFLVNPGKIVTTAMYDGIALNDQDAIAPGFGKLEEVGIPCAVYSGADAYPTSRAMISGNVDMVWDDQLQRLFVGFDDICLGDDAGYLVNGSGGACSIMVGREQGAKKIAGSSSDRALYFQPIIGPHFNSLLFQEYLSPGADPFPAKSPLPWAGKKPIAADTDYIVGFYQKHNPDKLTDANPNDDIHASAKKLRVMHTSTGKDYLVFNGGVAKKSALPALNAKMYALPLVGAYDENLMDVPEAGLVAAAERHDAAGGGAATDFYAKGLKGIKFKPVAAVGGNPAAGYTIGSADPDPDIGSINPLHRTVQKHHIIELLNDWDTHTPVGKQQSKDIWSLMKAKKPLISGLATTALAGCYVKTDGDIPGAAGDAGTRAFNLINSAGYNAFGPPVKDAAAFNKNGLIERSESVGLDKALDGAVVAGDRFKYQAQSDEVARYLNATVIGNAAVTKSANDAWDQVKVDHPTKFIGDGKPDLKIETAKFSAGPLTNAGDAGGIAAAVAGIEGSLGWAIHEIFKTTLHTTKLIPAIATMHADAGYNPITGAPPYPAFDYVRVGSDPKRLSYSTSANILDSWVVGDSVYVALGGTRDTEHTSEAGVFESKAIFHQDGFIRAWTPWRRVQGSVAPAGGVALDPTSSRFWTTTKKDATAIDAPDALDTLRITAWGKGNQPEPASDTRLSTALNQVFGDNGGIFGLYSFGPDTPGFKARNPSSGTAAERHEQFSLIVATGNNRVALVKSGQFDRKDRIFKPTDAYSTTDPKNVFVFDGAPKPDGNVHAGTALGKLGIITCAEVSRLPLAAAPDNRLGWLFVGGTGGLAVLTRWFNGKGWSTGIGEGLSELLPGAQRDDFPGGSGWRFMQILTTDAAGATINPFKDVRKIVSDGSKYLYVMTPEAIWRIDMMQAKQNPIGAARTPTEYSIFKRTLQNPPPPPPAKPDPKFEYSIVLSVAAVMHKVADTTANDAAGNPVFVNSSDKQFLDMMVGYNKTDGSDTQLVIGTTAGLFYNAITKLPTGDLAAKIALHNWTQLKTSNAVSADPRNKEVQGPVMRLEFTSSQPGGKMKPALDSTKTDQTYADGNLIVTALDPDRKYVATYRFNLTAEDWNDPTEVKIEPFNEPYHIGGKADKTTPYFYKLGTLNESEKDKIEFDGPFDYFPRTAHIANSTDGFADGVWMLPEPTSFVRDKATGNYEDIDLGLDLTLPLYFGNVQLEPASGAQVVAGEFGIRVND